MKVTVEKIFKSNKESRMKAFASVLVDDCLKITGIKIIEGNNGLFISMPSRQLNDGTFQDIIYPINQETRDLFTQTILDAYNEE